MLGWKALTEQTLNAFQMELAIKEAEDARDPSDSESERESAGSIPLSAQTSDEALRHWTQYILKTVTWLTGLTVTALYH